jgi:uncharacterized membrane protein YuzA (DUF378 family)
MVLVKQQIVYAIVYLIVGLFALFLIVNWINGYKDTKQKWGNDDVPTVLGVIKTIQIFIAGVMLLVFLFHIDKRLVACTKYEVLDVTKLFGDFFYM